MSRGKECRHWAEASDGTRVQALPISALLLLSECMAFSPDSKLAAVPPGSAPAFLAGRRDLRQWLEGMYSWDLSPLDQKS